MEEKKLVDTKYLSEIIAEILKIFEKRKLSDHEIRFVVSELHEMIAATNNVIAQTAMKTIMTDQFLKEIKKRDL